MQCWFCPLEYVPQSSHGYFERYADLVDQHHPEFEELGLQVAVVDYTNTQALQYTLRGVDLLISTIQGDSQLNLIEAARRARVRTFVPSEFEGALAHRSTADDPFDRGSTAALRLLSERSQSRSSAYHMRYTVFSCGVFYERFHPGGLAFFNIGAGANVQHPGEYLLDVNAATAEIVQLNAQGGPATVTMTSVYDVARFVAAAIDIGPEHWPEELRMRGDQLTVLEVIHACSTARGGKPSISWYAKPWMLISERAVPFNLVNHAYSNIQAHLDYAVETGDINRWWYFQRLRATADGRYVFARANLNELLDQTNGVIVAPPRFVDWLRQVYEQYELQPPLFPGTLPLG